MRFPGCLLPLLLIFLCGCSTTNSEPRLTKGTGDLGRFITEKALVYGAKNVSTNNLPLVSGSWKYFEDPDGVEFHLGPDHFREVQTLLRKAFGPPAHEPTQTTDHGELGWYAGRQIGVGLQFGYNKKRTYVILLRPRSSLFKRVEPAKN